MVHQPVLLQQVIEGLAVKSGQAYLDGTIGSAGHALEIAKKGGWVYGIDVDPEAVRRARARLETIPNVSFKVQASSFALLKQVADQFGVNRFSGILLDLGLSSEQLSDSSRGFSFKHSGPLDMRADPDLKVTAADLLNGLNHGELTKMLETLGEESRAKQVAAEIIKTRVIKPMTTTDQLADLVLRVYRSKRGKTHPATKTFQALRIAVNDELNNLKSGLPQALELLEPGGRLAVISFHSLEDRVVKQFIKESASLTSLTKKPIVASDEEIKLNPRSRSAKLRIAEKK